MLFVWIIYFYYKQRLEQKFQLRDPCTVRLLLENHCRVLHKVAFLSETQLTTGSRTLVFLVPE